MFGFKFLAVAAIAALACVVAATDSACGAPVTVTVTLKECATVPVNPAPTPPGTYAPPAAPPASSVESTGTAPLSVTPPAAPTTVIPSSGAPVAPSSGVVHSSVASAPGTTPAPSSTAANTRPSPSVSTPLEVSTAGAALATPYAKLGSLVAVGAAAMAVMV